MGADMKISTRNFGEIEVDDEKIITFEKGIIGFSELVHFTLIHDEEKGNKVGIHWLQSIEEPTFAMPVMDPLYVAEGYNPDVDDELLKPLAIKSMEDLLVLVTVTIPKDIKKMTVNLSGPMIINADNRKAAQVIVEGGQYEVRFPIYDILDKKRKEGEGKC